MKPVKDLPDGLRERLGGTDYLLCRACHRAFTRDDVIVDDDTFDKAVRFAPSSPDLGRLAEAVSMRARCPYESCRVPLDTDDWPFVRSRHPEYPQVPVEGEVYEEESVPKESSAEGACGT